MLCEMCPIVFSWSWFMSPSVTPYAPAVPHSYKLAPSFQQPVVGFLQHRENFHSFFLNLLIKGVSFRTIWKYQELSQGVKTRHCKIPSSKHIILSNGTINTCPWMLEYLDSHCLPASPAANNQQQVTPMCYHPTKKISKELKPENVNWSFYMRRSQLTVTMKQRRRSWVISNKLHQLPNLSGTADFLLLLAVLCGSSKMTLFDWIYLWW